MVLAKQGLESLVRKTNLNSYLPKQIQKKPNTEELSVAEKLRLSFEELGPTFVKLGQLLAQRPDLVPQNYCDEFQKLYDQVEPVPFGEIQTVLNSHFGSDYLKQFESFEAKTFAAGSIAQVHKAILLDGRKVVVKIQRPHLGKIISDDIKLLRRLSSIFSKIMPKVKRYQLADIVDEFAVSINKELDFVNEANNINKFEHIFTGNSSVVFPNVITELSGDRVLVMEEIEGLALSDSKSLQQPDVSATELLKVGLQTYMQMVFKHGLFHGDPHPGNLLVVPGNRIGFIDFGCVGRLSLSTRESLMSLFMAFADEDYERIAYEYMDLAPAATDIDVEQFATALRKTISPYYGLSLRYMNMGRILVATTSVAADFKLSLPTELLLFFRSLASFEAAGNMLDKDFSFIEFALELAPSVSASNYDPKRLVKNFDVLLKDTNSLFLTLPKQIKYFLRRLNSPNHAFELSVKEVAELSKAVTYSSKMIFWGLIIASLILSGSLIYALK